MKACVVNGCTDAAQSRGMCWRHFGRWRRQGDALVTGQHGGHTASSPTEPPDPGPVRVLRLQLQASRARKITFAVAWTAGLAVATDGLPDRLREEWTAVLQAHRAIWRAAYCRAPARRPFELTAPDEPGRPHRRTAPPLVLTGHRHDGPGTLEPADVPWCR